MDALTLALASLATFRVALMVATEEGPFSVFTRLRGALDPDQKTWLGRGINCAFCVSFWIAWPILALTWFEWGLFLVAGLALSGAACLLKKWMDRR